MSSKEKAPSAGPWAEGVFRTLSERDASWASAMGEASLSSWRSGVLSARFVELVAVAVNVAVTSLDADATRRHMRAALAAGATEAELFTLIKMGTVMALHSASLGAPILIEEAGAERLAAVAGTDGATPFVDRMKAMGQWNAAWDPFFSLDPHWTDAVMAAGVGLYADGVFDAKEMELLSIAFDASITHMYAPGTRRHIKGALAAGATVSEIMDVLKICVSRGVESCNLALPILADEVARARNAAASP